MTEKMKSFAKGILLGLCGHPLPQGEPTPPQGEPVAYLYNGVRLPKLPPLVHPYAAVEYYPGNHEYLLVDGPTLEYGTNTFGTPGVRIARGKQWAYAEDGANGEEWQEETPLTIPLWIPETTTNLIWTNTDLTYSDGGLWMAASEPVPVYE